MDARYIEWLKLHLPNERTRQTALSDVRRVEAHYGDVDALYDKDGLEGVLSELEYTAIDERNDEANPSKFEINGNLRQNLSSYRSHLRRYIRFKEDDVNEEPFSVIHSPTEESSLTFGLEKDMQTALRHNITQLEQGLEIIDGGHERHVPSGFIDILARDTNGNTVVIELKAVKAPLKAQSQIAAYMGDIAAEEARVPRGILVAPDFDAKLISAARVMPSLSLSRYSYVFAFEPIS